MDRRRDIGGVLRGVFVALLAGFCLAGMAYGQAPSNPHGSLDIACINCHTTASWTPLRAQLEFDHGFETGFPLQGMHKNVACGSCHVSPVFADAGTQCASCHADFHRGQLGANCESCHTVQGWRSPQQELQPINAHLNRFPLQGAHAALVCDSCHASAAAGNYRGLGTACVDCHLADFQNAKSVNHVAANFSTNCTSCHTAVRWDTATFNHNTLTSFALTGAHASVSCASCHTGGQYNTAPTACVGCHQQDFSNTTAPSHVNAGFPSTCESCHATQSWQGAKFDHSTTSFALTGKHAQATCASCHVGGRFAGTPQACIDCHRSDYDGTTNPNHATSNFSLQCDSCHTTVDWTGAKFDHSLARFALTGAHTNVACTSCHVNGQFTNTPSTCYDCHKTAYDTTTQPAHSAAGFPTTCETCHTTVQWAGAVFDHNTSTSFALTGAHTNVACASCHVNGQFKDLGTTCISCHQADFNGTTNPDHASAGFPTTCENCHNTVQWAGAVFDHNMTSFALTGAHTNVSCASCHVNGQFTGLGTACVNCHQADFDQTTDPNHAAAGFPTTCETCHNTVQWGGAVFDHNKTSFALTGSHTTVACATCHVNGQFAGLGTACVNCHQADFDRTTDPNHPAAGFPTTCETCHNTVQWGGAVFDHNTSTSFALTGAHTTVSCASCHVGGQFTGLGTECVSCHLGDFNATTDPNHAEAGFSQNCSFCHNTTQWQGAQFDHSKTSFALTGAHSTISCASCHVGGKFTGLGTACVDCHQSDFNATTDPNHAAAGFPTTCETCHNTVQWQGATFDHNASTSFALTGAHTSVACASCHVNGQFKGLGTACVDCHQSNFNATTDPNHVAAGFPTTCETCHTTVQWQGATFDHNTSTSFPLTGKHASVTCASCHVNGQFKGLGTACVDCHQSDFNATTDPNHAAAGFATTCENCHNTAQWQGAVFDHSTTSFALTGSHTSVACASCHVNGQFKGLGTACVSCHQNDFNATTNPNHAAAGFPTTCETCHTTVQWQGATFDHNTSTSFPLTGKHASVACASCHVNGQFQGLGTACVDCHQSDFNATTNPNHAAAGFATTCENCHNTVQWQGAVFDHSTTSFALTGAHTSVACASCHVNGQFKGLGTACVSCHQNDFNATTNPNHVAAGFPTACESCHTTVQWPGATFDHNTSTSFPLTGKHANVACASCHVNGQFQGLGTACVDCHQSDFNTTTNPNHVAAGFPTTCETCHNTVQWLGATFDHSTTSFPLTGKHTTVSCSACHVNGQFSGLGTACVTCHQSDFNATTNPNHVAAGFPTTCETCHNTVQWLGATFDHSTTSFPLTGKHTTVSCSACHINGQFSGLGTACVTCHQSDYQSATNPDHVGAGFPTTCETCHNTTQWLGATFDHSATGFALTGRHTTVACSSCHVGGVFQGTPTDCYSCHSAVYQSTANPNHIAAGFPTTCDTCHNTTQWTGATFNHTRFPITSGPHQQGQAWTTCLDCHPNQSNFAVFTCTTGCHPQSQTDSHHRQVRNYVYNSVNCYSCHPQGRAD